MSNVEKYTSPLNAQTHINHPMKHLPRPSDNIPPPCSQGNKKTRKQENIFLRPSSYCWMSMYFALRSVLLSLRLFYLCGCACVCTIVRYGICQQSSHCIAVLSDPLDVMEELIWIWCWRLIWSRVVDLFVVASVFIFVFAFGVATTVEYAYAWEVGSAWRRGLVWSKRTGGL